jgi:hypothetical protein
MTQRKSASVKKASPSTDRKQAVIISTPNPLIFISHDSRDAELAEAFSKLLSSISAGMLKSFRSSDKKGTEGIEFGVDWYPEVMSKIDSASDVVCLLTPRSIERPWILYEAGVAKGKMNTPVYGVALGIPLSSASTGPFAQFQNCGEDPDSLTKLVLQLMGRVSGAEPDKDTVKMQVETFKTRADLIAKKLPGTTPAHSTADEVEGSSVAKLFEEIKVMFRDLPERIEPKTKRYPPSRSWRTSAEMLINELDQDGRGPHGIGLLVLASVFKDDVPWLYEAAVQTYNTFSAGPGNGRAGALRRYSRICEMAANHPMFRHRHLDREALVAIMESASLANRLSDMLGRPLSRLEVAPTKKRATAEENKPD